MVGALIEDEGRYLLVLENHDPDRGKWNLPAGRLDLGENPIDGVRREVKEEAGLTFTPKSIVSITSVYREDVGTKQHSKAHALRIIYCGEAKGKLSSENNEVNADGEYEIAFYKWLSKEEISQPDIKLRYRDILKAISNFESNNVLPLDAITHIVQKPAES